MRGEDPCLVSIPSTGDEYREITCVYPKLAPLTSQQEIDYDPFPVLNVMKSHPWIPFAAVAIYGFLIYYGQIAMKKRDRLDWRNSMALWNLGLSIFSLMGTLRLLPYCLHNAYYMPMADLFCHNARGTFAGGSTGLWVQLFTLSKFPELIDTFFIVIHKKKLIFLHWYHHMSVVLMCWNSYVSEQPIAIYFCLMNYFVHTVMYFYYFLMTIKAHPKWFKPWIITFFQIGQMMVGVALTAAGLYYYNVESSCNVTKSNLFAVSLMYGSYLFLFCQFFVKRYLVKVKTGSQKKQV